jgi:VWFA-related protein
MMGYLNFSSTIPRSISLFSLLAVSSLVLFLSANRADCAAFSTALEAIDSSRFPSISSTITITTKEPLPQNLSDSFTLFEDEAKVDKWSARTDSRPMYVSIVLDRSGSMSGSMAYLKKAACDFVALMNEQTFCQVISFSDDVKINNNYTNNLSSVKRNIASLKPYGPTALYDALETSIKSLRYYPSSYRRVVIVFTDGKDQNSDGTTKQSSATAKDVVLSARNEGLPIYTIGLGEEISTKILDRMSALTGGKFYHSIKKEELSGIFRNLAVSLRVSYNFSYISPNPQRDGSIRKLIVKSKLCGEEDQGKGKYRAPKDLIIATASTATNNRHPNADSRPSNNKSPETESSGKGNSLVDSKFKTLLSNIFDKKQFGVEMSKEIANWSTNLITGQPVSTNLYFEIDKHDSKNIRQLSRIDSSIGDLHGQMEALTYNSNVHIEFRPPHTPKFHVDVNLPTVDGINGLELLSPQGMIATLMPLKALTDMPVSTDIELMLLSINQYGNLSMNGNDCFVITPKDIHNQVSKIFFDVNTMLPEMVVTSNPVNGATATTRYKTWFTEVTLPPMPELMNGNINIEAATKLAANISLATVADLNEVSSELDRLGPSLKLLSESNVKTNLESIDQFNRSFDKSTKEFNKTMDVFQKNLEDDLTKMTSNFEKQIKNFNKKLDEDLAKLNTSLEKQQREFQSNMTEQMQTLDRDMNNLQKNLTKDLTNEITDNIKRNLENNALDTSNMGNDIQKGVNDYLRDSGVTGSSGWGTSGDIGTSSWNDSDGNSSWTGSSDNNDDNDSNDNQTYDDGYSDEY